MPTRPLCCSAKQAEALTSLPTRMQDAVRAEMKALRDKESERASDVPALMKERDECRCWVQPLPAYACPPDDRMCLLRAAHAHLSHTPDEPGGIPLPTTCMLPCSRAARAGLACRAACCRVGLTSLS